LGWERFLTRAYKVPLEKMKHKVSESRPFFLIYMEANAKVPETFDSLKGFHIVRDPRDICVSAYFSHLYSHPIKKWTALKKHRQRIKQLPKEEGLLEEMNFLGGIFHNMFRWNYNCPHIMELKMEQFTRYPVRYFTRIFQFLGLLDFEAPPAGVIYKLKSLFNKIHFRYPALFPFSFVRPHLSSYRLERIVQKNTFKHMAKGRQRGESDPTSHYRKGEPGDWKNHFTTAHKKYFKKEYGDLLIKLGYEGDYNW
jgi:hypothetical protein